MVEGISERIRSELSCLRYLVKGNVAVLTLTWILFGIGHALVSPLFSRYIKMLGAGDFEVSLVRMMGLIATTIALIPGGYLTDKLGRRKIIVPFTFVIVSFSFIYAIVPDWKTLLIIWFIDSLFHFYTPALAVVLIDSLPPQVRARGLVFSFLIPNIPWFFFPPIGGYLSEIYGVNGIRLAYVIDGCIGLIAAFIRLKLLKETLPETTATSLPGFKAVIGSYRNIIKLAAELPTNIKMLLICCIFIIPYPMVFLETYGIIFAEEYLGINRLSYGAYISMSMLFSTIALIFILPFLDLYPRKYLAAIPFLLMFFAYTLLYVRRDPLSLLVLMTIEQASIVVSGSAIQAYVGDHTSIDMRGRVIALVRVVRVLGLSIANPIIGFLYSMLIPGDPYPAVMACILTSIVGATFLLTVLK